MGYIINPYIHGGGFSANAVNFSGSSNYLSHGSALTGSAVGKAFTYSIHFKDWAAVTSDSRLFNLRIDGNNFFTIYDDGTNLRVYSIYAGVVGLNVVAPSLLSIANWTHLIMSMDVTNASNRHIYVDDSPISPTYSTYSNRSIRLDGLPNVGSGYGNVDLFSGDMAEVWFDDQYLDISDSAVRRLFTDGSGKPVDLLADGSGPTGSAPLVFLSGETANWHTNKGAGGGFTENGTLTTASTSPSD